MTTADLTLAVDVGGTSVKGELVDADGRVHASERAATPHGDAALDAIGLVGDRLLGAAGAPVAAAGVVVPGLVDPARGVAAYSANIGWRDLAVTGPLGRRWGVPVRLGHDVASAAVAELAQGAGRGCRDVAFVVIGTGVAAVVVAGGRLVTGHRGEIAEIGHLPLRAGPACPCGAQGCVEAVASAAAISRRYAELTGLPVEGAHEVLARSADDPVAARVWRDAVDVLAEAVAALALVVAPELVVVGGGLADAGPALLDPLAAGLERRCRVVAAPRLARAELGPRAGVVGAALLARDGWSTT